VILSRLSRILQSTFAYVPRVKLNGTARFSLTMPLPATVHVAMERVEQEALHLLL
jgi:hypothetical protein